ncbi:Retinol dehydrogenase 14 [Smittium culicis]|uniref:Retinol dehydrogenase 14 n=1 Tax=Smittium culicis TaxID=133412 RepID=A0A1R1YFE5_9FUNG|nr:Retinol dehydrogenase 14 [Smittium culicis]
MLLLEKIVNSSESLLLPLCQWSNITMFGFRMFSFSVELSYNILFKILFRKADESRLLQYSSLHKKKYASNSKKIAIVTGANSGIGYETTRALALAGFHVVMACRNKNLAEQAIESLKIKTNLDSFEFIELDLSSFASINAFISHFKSLHKSLDLLINNAGVMMCPYSLTKDGIEMQFGTNHVGHFILTNGLIDLLLASHSPRLIFVSSLVHYSGRFENYDFLKEHNYNKYKNYSISKICNIMFATELARKYKNTNLVVNSLHPGVVNTNLGRHVLTSTNSFLDFIKSALTITPTHGALTTIKLALSPDVESISGKYFSKELEVSPLGFSQDEKACADLWNFTESIIKNHSKN